MLRELTEAEKAKPFAKYYHRTLTEAPREIYNTLAKGPIGPSLALNIEDRNDLLSPGYLPCERGVLHHAGRHRTDYAGNIIHGKGVCKSGCHSPVGLC
jgi:hypothetical protein